MAMALPVMSFASGATNSMSTALRPISASFGTAFAGSQFGRRGWRGPHAVPHARFVSLAFGGGSIVLPDPLAVGPHSVGYRLTKAALVFGGRTITATGLRRRRPHR
jgi:N-methylhydantoinase A/oxoprolinase/acetone carboxylase beta subunit